MMMIIIIIIIIIDSSSNSNMNLYSKSCCLKQQAQQLHPIRKTEPVRAVCHITYNHIVKTFMNIFKTKHTTAPAAPSFAISSSSASDTWGAGSACEARFVENVATVFLQITKTTIIITINYENNNSSNNRS